MKIVLVKKTVQGRVRNHYDNHAYFCLMIFVTISDHYSDGCPCDDYDCQIADIEESSVLVLQHGGGDNKLDPFIIDYYGNVKSEIDFSFDENTDLNGACSVNYRDRAYVFGGLFQPRQVIIVYRYVVLYLSLNSANTGAFLNRILRSVMFVVVSFIKTFKPFHLISHMDLVVTSKFELSGIMLSFYVYMKVHGTAVGGKVYINLLVKLLSILR